MDITHFQLNLPSLSSQQNKQKLCFLPNKFCFMFYSFNRMQHEPRTVTRFPLVILLFICITSIFIIALLKWNCRHLPSSTIWLRFPLCCFQILASDFSYLHERFFFLRRLGKIFIPWFCINYILHTFTDIINSTFIWDCVINLNPELCSIYIFVLHSALLHLFQEEAQHFRTGFLFFFYTYVWLLFWQEHVTSSHASAPFPLMFTT